MTVTRPLEELISPHILEASNGVLLAVCVLAAVGALLNLFWRWREFDWGVVALYRECKASIALSWLFSGVALLTFPKWWLRHAANHGLGAPSWEGLSGILVVAGTIAAALGVLCWLRETFPEVLGRWTWLGLLIAVLVFGLGLAL